jgi:hypothetical protein
MRRVNQMRFYRLGQISKLASLEAGQGGIDYATFFEETTTITMQLEAFVENDEHKHGLPMAVEKAGALIKKLINIYNGRRIVGDDDIHELHFMTLRFETSLDDELQRLPTYMVDQVGAYSFDRLIGRADTVFPESQRKQNLIPEQIAADFCSAGRCLAFDLPTACGFHAFRAADAMIRAYYAHFIGSPPCGKEPRDWGGYIRELKKAITNNNSPKIPNERTVALLDSIRAMDRNPVIHPEQDLDADTALATFDLCKNAITLMAIDIRDHP